VDKYLSASEARQRFLQLIDEAIDGDQIIVTRRGTPAVVLIDFERLETIKQIARLWQDPEAIRAMRKADEEVSAGRTMRLRKIPGVRELIAKARGQGLLRG
jgi:prevent-host-death family protein